MWTVIALGSSRPNVRSALTSGWEDYLASFHYKIALQYIPEDRTPRLFLLDSGAFTAWSQGQEIDFEAYTRFAVERTAMWPHTHTINLDVIPGEMGRDSTPAEREAAMAASLAHADKLRAEGLRVTEVYHQDEPVSFLRLLIERRREGEILGISPRNDVSQKAKREWLLKVLRQLIHDGGPRSLPPMHGLAVTARPLLEAFPFFSVDSSSWSAAFRWGRIPGHEAFKGRTLYETYGATHEKARLNSEDHLEILTAAVHTTIRGMGETRDRVTRLWESRGVAWQLEPAALIPADQKEPVS